MPEWSVLAERRRRLELRALVMQSVRSFFRDAGFLEVETPLLTAAPAPEPHIEAIPADNGLFLISSPELYMKRLLAAGFGNIFQITRAFRRGERGRLHHPEFALLEWYRAHADYTALQSDCRKLLEAVVRDVADVSDLRFRDNSLEVEGEWGCYTVREAFLEFAGWEPWENVDQLRFDIDLVEKVEPRLGFPHPCFLRDYPADLASLARLKPDDPSVAERFELYWAGIELANGFSELTDPVEQRSRFEAAAAAMRDAGRAPYPVPEAFLNSMERLPPCAGIALGVDRLVMLLAGADCIDDVTAFEPDAE